MVAVVAEKRHRTPHTPINGGQVSLMNLELYKDVLAEVVEQSKFFFLGVHKRSMDAGMILCRACLSCMALDPW